MQNLLQVYDTKGKRWNKFVVVRKDSYTAIEPFDNMETLMDDVSRLCEYMKIFTWEEKELVIDTVAKRAETMGGNFQNSLPYMISNKETIQYSQIFRRWPRKDFKV